MNGQSIRRSTRPFGGYDVVRSRRDDTELTDTNKGSPAGEYLRRFWQPIALTSDLKDVPVLVKFLGEELVIFRDRSGKIGLLHKNCSHRGASLEFGLIVENGIRCAYHGWHFGIDGEILEIPELGTNGAADRKICHGAYPTREHDGLIFAYLGPPDEIPAFPIYDFMVAKDERRIAYRFPLPTNWVHVRENSQDPIHLSFLHTMFSIQQFGNFAPELPYIKAHKTPIGQFTNSIRRLGDRYYSRINEMILPNIAKLADHPAEGIAIFANKAMDMTGSVKAAARLKYKWQEPANHGLGVTMYTVPNDNESCMFFGWIHIEKNADPEVAALTVAVYSHGQMNDRPYAERQHNPGDFDVLVSQGPRYSPDNDVLTQADAGIVLYRRQLREGIRAVQAGQAPKGLLRVANGTIPTYCHSLFKPAPPSGSDAEDLDGKIAVEAQTSEEVLGGQIKPTARVLTPY